MFAVVAGNNQNNAITEQDGIAGLPYAVAGEAGPRNDSAEEAALTHAALAGDLSAFNHLVIAHQDSLYWWVYSLVKDEALAADITQSTFLTAYEKLFMYRGGSFRAWLFRIARNRSFDELRHQKRHPSVSIDESTDEGEDYALLSVLPDQSPLPEDVFEETEQGEIIERLLERLPVPFQQVLRLVDMEGLDYQEAAGVLRLPLGTVKSRLTRARLKLRQLFAQNGYLLQ